MNKRKIKVVDAKYVKKAKSIAIIGECEDGRLTSQIHQSCFSFKGMGQDQIDYEMEKTAKLMIGKRITLAYDPNISLVG